MTIYPPQTHVMVPPELRDRLKALSQASRVPQAIYLREAANLVLGQYHLLVKLGERRPEDAPNLVNLVFRLPDDLREGLRDLSARTRVRVGEYMRLALESIVTRYEEKQKAGAA